jgi:hypothetical protein
MLRHPCPLLGKQWPHHQLLAWRLLQVRPLLLASAACACGADVLQESLSLPARPQALLLHLPLVMGCPRLGLQQVLPCCWWRWVPGLGWQPQLGSLPAAPAPPAAAAAAAVVLVTAWVPSAGHRATHDVSCQQQNSVCRRTGSMRRPAQAPRLIVQQL